MKKSKWGLNGDRWWFVQIQTKNVLIKLLDIA